jgi:chlorobactene glucosyltransferase
MSAVPWPAWLLSALWTGWIVRVVVRFLDSRALDDFTAAIPPDAPLVSVIIPARDEARNIERCLRSVLASAYPSLDVIVVDDHSTDGTGAIARRVAEEDPQRRVRVIAAPPLPEGWFGKQWACHTGARAARGDLLLFTDADTRHGSELLPRSVNAMRAHGTALFTVAGRQEMETFWEKVVQPFVFALLLSRYGSLETMSRTARPRDRIANGQFLLFTREAYDRAGGHESVRHHVAEDLLLAQRFAELGLPMQMVLGRDHLSTRMYTSLGEIRRGWGKNMFAAGRDTLPAGALTQRILPFIFPLPALVALVPTVAFALGAAGLGGPGMLWFGILAGSANLLFWIGVYAFSKLNPLWALLHPLAALVVAWILAESAWRGSRVAWKGRQYLSRSS